LENRFFVRGMIISASALILWLFFPFLKSFFIAFLLSIVLYPLHRYVETRLVSFETLNGMRTISAAALVTAGLFLVLFVPLSMFLYYLFDQPSSVLSALSSLGETINTLPSYLPSYLQWLSEPLDHIISVAQAHRDEIITTLAAWLGSGLQTFAMTVAEMAMIVVFSFFLLWYGNRLLLFLLPIIPLSRTLKRRFFSDMMTTTAVVFYTLGGVMLAQGVAFGIFIAFFEGYNPFLLGFMTAISSVIPVVGTALVWIPVALHEYFEGNIMNALIISLYSWAMMAFFIDNIVKLVILNFVNRKLNEGSQGMNEFIIFFAIVGGLATFGFWGFIFGPAIVAFALTVIKMLRKTKRHFRP
jgi:predicted PurR-regulated permease PerM